MFPINQGSVFNEAICASIFTNKQNLTRRQVQNDGLYTCYVCKVSLLQTILIWNIRTQKVTQRIILKIQYNNVYNNTTSRGRFMRNTLV